MRFPVSDHLARMRARLAAEFDSRAARPLPYRPTCLIVPEGAERAEVETRIREERTYADERPMRRARRY